MPHYHSDSTEILERWSTTANLSATEVLAEQRQEHERAILPQAKILIRPLPQPTENSTPGGSTQKDQANDQPQVSPLIRLKTSHIPHRKFKVLQQFECAVTSIQGASFDAELSDLTDPTKPIEFATFPVTEVSPPDLSLLIPGCVFYWILGYETREGGQITRVSEIRFRRSPRWSRRAIELMTTNANTTYKRFTPPHHDGQPSQSEESAPRAE